MAALLLGLEYFSGAVAGQRPRNILLITLDTTRADHLGCYGHAAAQTPALDELAENGVVFDQAFSSAPMTLPSHATILTGLWPPEHGLRTNGEHRLDLSDPTLAEVLQQQGYRTGAFIASFTLDSRNGLDRGFEVYDDDMATAYDHRGDDNLGEYRPGDRVTNSALAWLEGQSGEEPFFCWVHLFDPHLPYYPHRELSDTPLGARAGYDAEVAFMDMQVGRLTAFLTREDLAESTLVVAVGDHGEGLDEHGELDHGYMLYGTTLHVPLMFSLPGTIQGGRRVGAVVSLVDLYATILDLLDVGEVGERSGRSIAAALFGHEIGSLPSYGETDLPFTTFNWSPLQSLTTAKWKYIRSARPHLYDRLTDPEELDNLAMVQAEKLAELEEQLQALEGRMVAHAAERIEQTAEDIARLAALGYISSGQSTPAAGGADHSGLQDIEDMLPVLRRVPPMRALGREGMYDRQIEMLQEMLETSPESAILRKQLAGALEKVGRVEECISECLEYLLIEPDDAEVRRNLGVLYAKQGKLGEAVKQFSDSLEVEPDSVFARRNLGILRARQGRPAQAIEHFTAVLELQADDAPAHRHLGDLYRQQGKLPDARKHYSEALRTRPDDAAAHTGLGIAWGMEGRFAEALACFSKARRIDPADGQPLFLKGGMLEAQGKTKEAVTAYREALRLGNSEALNSLAWILATHPEAEIRDGREAVDLAERACQGLGLDRPGLMDTLAAAYAEAGRYPEATATAHQAVQLASNAGDERLAKDISERLEIYEAGRPFRQTAP